MSRALAVVVLAHADPPFVNRMLHAMRGADQFLHVDALTDHRAAEMMTDGLAHELDAIPRRRTTRTSWSLVRAELDGLRTALERSSAEHIAVMSGNCYPLHSMSDMADLLQGWRDETRLHHFPIPHRYWDTTRNRDGGMWRFNRRFVVLGDQTVHVRGMPLRWRRRSIPAELTLTGGSQWKVYARGHARRLLEVLDGRPQLREFFKHSYVPDEACIPTVLASPPLFGDEADRVVNSHPWFLRWDPDGERPEWLGMDDLDALSAAANALGPVGGVESPSKLFARKLRTTDGCLVDRIDEVLRR